MNAAFAAFHHMQISRPVPPEWLEAQCRAAG
jgi:hypothetical protein